MIWARFVVAASVWCYLAAVATADTVVLAPEEPGQRESRLEGTIVELSGATLLLDTGSGASRRIPMERVRSYDTHWLPEHAAARQAIARGQWADATAKLTSAGRAEPRNWVRRLILAELVECHMATGRWEHAGEVFVSLVGSDPLTPFWSRAPLAWYPSVAVRPNVAQRWLTQSDNEVTRLLGASWLVATNDRSAAEAELRRLVHSNVPPIAQLAEAQLWRTELPAPEVADVERWGARVEGFPESLQAGPWFVVAEGRLALAQNDAAALAALRVPILHEAPRQLAARSLVLAAQAMERGDHRDEARRLLTEVRDRYTETPERQDAAALLRAIDDSQ